MFIEREYGVTFSYCIECSQQAYIDKDRNIMDFNEANLMHFGKEFLKSFHLFGELLENQAIQHEKKK